jgi:predicted transposase YbfD/YdcC
MADINVSGGMLVGTLRSQFKTAFNATLRVYKGKIFADDKSTLASIRAEGSKKSGDLVIRGNMLVGNFETAFEAAFGIKIQVATPDNSALSDNSITISAAGKVSK